MSRKPIIAGNWKMNKTLAEAQAFAEAVKGKAPSADLVDTVIGSPALFLAPLAYNLKDDVIQLAAQNSYFENAVQRRMPASASSFEITLLLQ